MTTLSINPDKSKTHLKGLLRGKWRGEREAINFLFVFRVNYNKVNGEFHVSS